MSTKDGTSIVCPSLLDVIEVTMVHLSWDASVVPMHRVSFIIDMDRAGRRAQASDHRVGEGGTLTVGKGSSGDKIRSMYSDDSGSGAGSRLPPTFPRSTQHTLSLPLSHVILSWVFAASRGLKRILDACALFNVDR